MKNIYRFWAIFAVLVAFAAGLLAGFWAERYLVHKRRPPFGPRPPREAVHFPSLEQMSWELGLSTEQQDQIRQIFERNDARLKELRSEMHARLTEIRSKLKAELEAVLTPEQRQKFEEMIDKYVQQRKKEFEKRRGNFERERSPNKPEGEKR